MLHGDDFHAGFVETRKQVGALCPGFMYWPDILRFNWDCMLSIADKALECGVDVMIDYVVEDELPLVETLARSHEARLHYAALTASETEIRSRLTQRGDPQLIDRSLFMKSKLEALQENTGHLVDTTGMSM